MACTLEDIAIDAVNKLVAEDFVAMGPNDRDPWLVIIEAALRAVRTKALEEAAGILESQQVIYHSLAPHLRLVPNKPPDEVRKMYAAAIRSLAARERP